MKFFVALTLFFSLRLLATELKINYSSFEEANKSSQYLKFKGKSTKLGLITTEFIGLSKSYLLKYDIKDNKLSTLEIIIDKKMLDTDNKMRDEKMHNQSLLSEKNNEIKVRLLSSVELKEESSAVVNASIKIIEKELTLPLTYQTKEDGNQYIISFTTKFSFVEAGIPDPSIMVAKVDEHFSIEGKIILPKN